LQSNSKRNTDASWLASSLYNQGETVMHDLPLAVDHAGRKNTGASGWLARTGSAMRRHRRPILALQWMVVFFYLLLLIVPALMPLPAEDAHIYDNLRMFAQFLFWGIWWPFVMVTTMLLGRVWCGVFCPEGSLTEFASYHGLGRPIPRWMRWSGWPFVAFVCTTVYGQLISVYEYPEAALLVLGGSSIAALTVGLIYGRGKRVWCRYLCPANGVFALLAKIAPVHFRVNEEAWKRNTEPQPRINCAPLIDIRHMKSASACHACGRCSDYRGAVQLAVRTPAHEILNTRNKDASTEEALTLIFGVLGIATAAFQWSASSWFIRMKTAAAEWLIERDALLLLNDNAPWWLLTHYPKANDVFTWLDGACILAYLLVGGTLLGLAMLAAIRLAARLANDSALSWQRLALALVPLAGMGIFLGLSMLTLAHLKAERISLECVPAVRIILLVLGSTFSAWLGWKLLVTGKSLRRLLAFAVYALPIILIDWIWAATFFP
jgi:polyferredoxin